MDGIGGRGGWAWIFILEGILTVAVAIWAYWAFKDYPYVGITHKTLTTADTLPATPPSSSLKPSATRSTAASIKTAARSPKSMNKSTSSKPSRTGKCGHTCSTSLGACRPPTLPPLPLELTYLSTFTAVYSFSLFLPTIVRDLGYSNNQAQLMTVPPYVVACVCCLSTGYLSDRLASRGVFMVFWNLIGVVGLIMLVAQRDVHVKYAGTFFFACGVYPNVPQCMAWNGNNTGGSTKRSISLAMQAMCGNLGGILASFIYLSRNGPQYIQGHCILIGLLTMSGSISAIMTSYYRRENRRRDREYKKPEEYTIEEKALEREKGDDATFFRFTV